MLNVKTEDGIVVAEFSNGKYNTITLETLNMLDKTLKQVRE